MTRVTGALKGKMADGRVIEFVTREFVEFRLHEALDVLKRLAMRNVRPAGFKSNMPEIVRTFWEVYGIHKAHVTPPAPSAKAIDRMEEALLWPMLISDEEIRRVVWSKAVVKTVRWKHMKDLEEKFGMSRQHLNRLNNQGLEEIVWKINRELLP